MRYVLACASRNKRSRRLPVMMHIFCMQKQHVSQYALTRTELEHHMRNEASSERGKRACYLSQCPGIFDALLKQTWSFKVFMTCCTAGVPFDDHTSLLAPCSSTASAGRLQSIGNPVQRVFLTSKVARSRGTSWCAGAGAFQGGSVCGARGARAPRPPLAHHGAAAFGLLVPQGPQRHVSLERRRTRLQEMDPVPSAHPTPRCDTCSSSASRANLCTFKLLVCAVSQDRFCVDGRDISRRMNTKIYPRC